MLSILTDKRKGLYVLVDEEVKRNYLSVLAKHGITANRDIEQHMQKTITNECIRLCDEESKKTEEMEDMEEKLE